MLPPRIAQHPTLYRVHPVSFRDGNGDGLGDYAGLMEALPYLHRLSVDGVLLPQEMPASLATQQQILKQGLAVWLEDASHPERMQQHLPLPRTLRTGALAQQVMPFSPEKLVATLFQQRHELAHSLWTTGDAQQARVVSRWGLGDLRSANAYLTLLAMLPAPICLYQGEELALPHAAALHDTRGAQSPMPWHEAPEQATVGEIHWYQRVAIEHRAMAISRQQQDSSSTLRFCQSLLALRRQPVIQQGTLSDISLNAGVIRLLVTYQDQCIEALINLQPYTQAATPSEATLPLAWQCGAQQEGHQWVLAGFSSAIFTRKTICESMGVTHG